LLLLEQSSLELEKIEVDGKQIELGKSVASPDNPLLKASEFLAILKLK
jgi:hypothetical protein